jgi:hypothetical protein
MTPATTGYSEDQIRALLDERVRAIHDRDAQALVSPCAPDVVSFDALPPLQRLGPTNGWVGTTVRSATTSATCGSRLATTRHSRLISTASPAR